jgi:DNA-binding MarR family transcriptional regulator
MSTLKETISNFSYLIEKILDETICQADFIDLTQQQFHYLQVIVKMKNPTLTEFAKEINLTKPTVTVLVDKLVNKGYIKRIKSDKDRRSMHLHIDEKGGKITALREIAYERIAEKIKMRLNDTETTILSELLKKLAISIPA